MLAVSEAIASHRDLSALFHELAGRLHQVVRFDSLALVLHEAATNTMRLHVLETSEPTPHLPAIVLPVEDDPAGLVWQTQQPLIISSVAEERPLAAVPGTSAAVWSPELLLAAADHGPAAAGHAGLRVASSRPPTMTADVGFLQLVANQVAVAVENALAFQEIEAAFREIRRSRTSSPRRMPTWRRRSAPSTTSARSSGRAPPCAGC